MGGDVAEGGEGISDGFKLALLKPLRFPGPTGDEDDGLLVTLELLAPRDGVTVGDIDIEPERLRLFDVIALFSSSLLRS